MPAKKRSPVKLRGSLPTSPEPQIEPEDLSDVEYDHEKEPKAVEPTEKISKVEAVRRCLAANITTSADIQHTIKQRWDLDMSTAMISNYKSNLKTKGMSTTTRSLISPVPIPSVSPQVEIKILDVMRELKPLLNKVGKKVIHELVDLMD